MWSLVVMAMAVAGGSVHHHGAMTVDMAVDARGEASEVEGKLMRTEAHEEILPSMADAAYKSLG